MTENEVVRRIFVVLSRDEETLHEENYLTDTIIKCCYRG
jgi:hypothetical protein